VLWALHEFLDAVYPPTLIFWAGRTGVFPRAKKLNPVLLVLSVLRYMNVLYSCITEISGIGLGDNPGLEHRPYRPYQ